MKCNCKTQQPGQIIRIVNIHANPQICYDCGDVIEKEVKLKKCPFCGEEVEYHTTDEGIYAIRCCHFWFAFDTKDELFDAWNTRPETGLAKFYKWWLSLGMLNTKMLKPVLVKIEELLKEE